MLNIIGKKEVLVTSLVATLIMSVVVMIIVNPLIDGSDGMGVIKLQLSFTKQAGIAVVNSWGESGITFFKRWIFTDYIYAFAYALFFASTLSFLILKKGKSKTLSYTWVVYLALAASVFDWVENSIELLFLNNPTGLPDTLFFLHSVLATIKLAAIPIAIIYIVFLLTRKDVIYI